MIKKVDVKVVAEGNSCWILPMGFSCEARARTLIHLNAQVFIICYMLPSLPLPFPEFVKADPFLTGLAFWSIRETSAAAARRLRETHVRVGGSFAFFSPSLLPPSSPLSNSFVFRCMFPTKWQVRDEHDAMPITFASFCLLYFAHLNLSLILKERRKKKQQKIIFMFETYLWVNFEVGFFYLHWDFFRVFQGRDDWFL